MTPRERVVAASRGGVVEGPVRAGRAGADLIVCESTERLAPLSDRMQVVELLNPFGRARLSGLDINRLLADDPAEGAKELERLAVQTHAQIVQSLESGADGVFYRVVGATPDASTPMEYGGHHLEIDRAILVEFEDAFNVLFVEGTDPYLDFVSDLPARFFGWEVEKSPMTVGEVRTLRQGALIAAHPDADVVLDLASAPLFAREPVDAHA